MPQRPKHKQSKYSYSPVQEDIQKLKRKLGPDPTENLQVIWLARSGKLKGADCCSSSPTFENIPGGPADPPVQQLQTRPKQWSEDLYIIACGAPEYVPVETGWCDDYGCMGEEFADGIQSRAARRSSDG